MHHLALAFVLGGLFFSRFLPPFLAGCAALWRRIHSKGIFTRKIRSQQSKDSKEPLDFDTVSRPALVVLQHVVERLAGRSFQTQMRRALKKGLAQVSLPSVRSVQLHSLVTNRTTPPKLKRGRIYRFDAEDDGMAFDVDLEWDDCVQAEIHITTQRLGLSLPIKIENCRFRGPVRIILTPLRDEPPGFGACLVSLPRLPVVMDLDMTISGGQITQVPWLKEELVQALQQVLTERLVWPRRVVNPMLNVPPEPASNCNVTTILAFDDLQALEHSDPLLEKERAMIRDRQKRQSAKPSTWTTPNTTNRESTAWDTVLESVVRPISTLLESGEVFSAPNTTEDDGNKPKNDGLFKVGQMVGQAIRRDKEDKEDDNNLDLPSMTTHMARDSTDHSGY